MSGPTAADLATIELFANLDESQRTVVSSWLEVEEADAGRKLTHQGAAGYSFFILREGAADVIVDGATVRTLGAGDFFGEIALIGTGRQTATVQLTSPAVLWTMFGTRFRELEAEHPDIAATLTSAAQVRLSAG